MSIVRTLALAIISCLAPGATLPRAMRVEDPGAIYHVKDRGDRRKLSGQLRKSGTFIVPASKQNRLKPHRGGMVRSGEGHAAPTELERIIGGTVTPFIPKPGLLPASSATGCGVADWPFRACSGPLCRLSCWHEYGDGN